MSLEQIEARLQDRFRLLTGGVRTAVARLRTLEATVAWSYQLLTDVEQVLLNRVSVFPASWTLEAAEQVCGGDGIDARDMLDGLSRLVDKSLLAIERHAGGARRYRLLETVRQYARDRLIEAGDADRMSDRHFECCFHELRGALLILRGPGQVSLLRRLALTAFELGDHQAARARALEARDAADAGCDAVEHGGPLLVMANVAAAGGYADGAARLWGASDVRAEGRAMSSSKAVAFAREQASLLR